MQLIQGDSLEILKTLKDNSVDCIVTDPPAGIGFMNKEWDSDKGGRDLWMQWLTEVFKEAQRVLKAGGHGLVWALPRTSHWTAMALENAGFEIRDCVYHIQSQGFPKSLNVSKAIDKKFGAERQVIGENPNCRITSSEIFPTSDNKNITAPSTDKAKEYDGYGSQLKPAVECWWLIRKPLSEKSIVDNVLKHGTGAINIDKSRIPTGDNLNGGIYSKTSQLIPNKNEILNPRKKPLTDFVQPTGRFPANLIHDGSPSVMEEFAKYGESKSSVFPAGGKNFKSMTSQDGREFPNTNTNVNVGGYDDNGSVARFFYCSKASTSERNLCGKSNHPTVKSVKLMSYLVNLVMPPKGIVLDMFMGTGTTGIAALLNGYDFIGIELQEEYMKLAQARINNYEEFRKYLK